MTEKVGLVKVENFEGEAEILRVIYLPKRGTHRIEIRSLPVTTDHGVFGLILADALRTIAGVYASAEICSRRAAEKRIEEVFKAEMRMQTSVLTEFSRPEGAQQ